MDSYLPFSITKTFTDKNRISSCVVALRAATGRGISRTGLLVC